MTACGEALNSKRRTSDIDSSTSSCTTYLDPLYSSIMEELTIEKAQHAFQSGSFTARDLVTYYLKQIEDVDKSGSRLNGVLAVSATALHEAEALDQYLQENGTFQGPLHGIPVIVKDQAATAGITTTYGSIKAKDNVPDEDATLVTKLKEAGAIILAKSTMPGEHDCDPSEATGAEIEQTGQHPGSQHHRFRAQRGIRMTYLETWVAPVPGQVRPLRQISQFLALVKTLEDRSVYQVRFVDWSGSDLRQALSADTACPHWWYHKTHLAPCVEPREMLRLC
jgi:Amidase